MSGQTKRTAKPKNATPDTSDNAQAPKHKRFLIESDDVPPEILAGINVKPAQDGRVWTEILEYTDIRIHGVVKRYHIIEHVQTDVLPMVRFAIAVCTPLVNDGDKLDCGPLVIGPNNGAQRYILKRGYSKTDGTKVPDVVLYVGQINVMSQYLAYTIESDRTLKDSEYLRFVHIETISEHGVPRPRDIAAQDMRQQQNRATWIENLDLGASGNVSAILQYIRVRMNQLTGKDLTRVYGQGPIIDSAGTRVLITLSGSIDEFGTNRPDITANLNGGLNREYHYYDITPIDQQDKDKIVIGVRALLSACDEIPRYPEIPIAFLANIFTAVLTTIEPRFFNVPMLTGIPGSGKTRYSNRFDAIQSRTVRDVRKIKPALNLGDTTGTAKGDKYRATEFGGFAIATDDVIKDGDSQFHAQAKSDTVSNLIRSYESGAGALGRVNREQNRVVSGQSGKMQGNFRVLSEKPILGTSTLERVIRLPHLNVKWNEGLFNTALGIELNRPEIIEAQHHAYSAIAVYAFTHLTRMAELYEQAIDITRTWNVDARMSERYAAVLAAHLIFADFINENRITDGKNKPIDTVTYRDRVSSVLTACAVRQARKSRSLSDLFRLRVRQMLTAGRISFVGRPLVDAETDTEIMPYSNAFRETRVTSKSDESMWEITREYPPGINSVSELGIDTLANGQKYEPKGAVSGYVKFPRESKRGGRTQKTGSIDTANRWTILIPIDDQMFSNLMTTLTKFSKDIDGYGFTAKEIIDMLNAENAGKKSRVRLRIDADGHDRGKNPASMVEIDAEWLFETIDDEEDAE